jgi:hypothetical protein
MITANDVKQPQATGKCLVSFGSDPPIAPGYTRVCGCSGADFGGPLRAKVRFLEFDSSYTIVDRRG